MEPDKKDFAKAIHAPARLLTLLAYNKRPIRGFLLFGGTVTSLTK